MTGPDAIPRTGTSKRSQDVEIRQSALGTGFDASTTAEEVISGLSLDGKIAIVTGGHSGLGLETTRALSTAGAKVVVGSRNVRSARAAVAALENVEVVNLDLSSPAVVDRFAEEFLSTDWPLDILINNAGLMAMPLTRDPRGYEIQFAVNHLGHFQLTARLWPALRRANGARVIAVSSLGHRLGAVDLEDPNFDVRPYDKWAAYGQSKSANSLFAIELDRRGRPHGIRAFAVHPGRIVATDLLRNLSREEIRAAGIHEGSGVRGLTAAGGVGKTIPQGAATTIWATTSPLLAGRGGVYCENCDIAEIVPDDSTLQGGVRRWAIDRHVASDLWKLSELLTEVNWPSSCRPQAGTPQ